MKISAIASTLPAAPIPAAAGRRLYTLLERGETKLDALFAPTQFQIRVDQFLIELKKAFAFPGADKTKKWLQDNGHGDWMQQLAVFLAKLPAKAAHNIVGALLQITHWSIHGAAYTLAHPLKAPLELAKLILVLIHHLAEPETWTRIGAATLGSTLGYSAITPTPLSPVALLVGATLTLTGVTVRMLKEPLASLRAQAALAAEEFATGFCVGFLFGAVQQIGRGLRQYRAHCKYDHELYQLSQSMGREQAAEFLAQHNFPGYDRFACSRHTIRISWDSNKAHVYHFPPCLEGAQQFFDRVIDHFIPLPYTDYIHTYSNGVEIVEPVVRTHWVPIYKDVIGYEFPLVGWNPPPPPPPLPPVANAFDNRVLPAALAATTHP